MYSTMADLQNRLPFTLDANSKPTATQASGVWQDANWIVNSKLGVTSDFSSASGLRWVENDLAVRMVRDMHGGEVAEPNLTDLHLSILDNYRSSNLVSLSNVEFGW